MDLSAEPMSVRNGETYDRSLVILETAIRSSARGPEPELPWKNRIQVLCPPFMLGKGVQISWSPLAWSEK